MENNWVIFIILFSIFIIYIYYSYDIYKLEEDEYLQDRRNDRIRCPPKIFKQEQKTNDDDNKYKINLFTENETIKNKGFINELMYKPSYDSTLPHTNELYVPNIPLNDYHENENMQFANVHLNYLLK